VVDNCFNKAAVSLTHLYLPAWPGVRFYYIGNVVAFLSSKIDEVTPIGFLWKLKTLWKWLEEYVPPNNDVES